MSDFIFSQNDDSSFDSSNQSENKDSNAPKSSANSNGKAKKKEGNWSSMLVVLVVVFGTIFLWNAFYQPSKFEIPLMQLVKLIEQGNPRVPSTSTLSDATRSESVANETQNDEKIPSSSETPNAADSPTNSKPSAPFIVVQEGKGRNEKTVKYSDLKEICIGSHEVTGKITREILEPKDENQPLMKNVDFFSGRQGLNFDNNDLFNRLEKNGFDDVRAKGNPGFMEQYGFTLLMTGAFLFFLFYLFRKGAGAMAFGRTPGILIAPEDVDISFNDVAGVDEAVEELKEIVEFLQTPTKFQILGGRIPKGVLLVGPPGTGKTLLAKAVAGEAGVPFFSLSGSDFVELYAGVGAARVRDLFDLAQRNSPCIVFIDELDALGKSRTGASFGAHDEREQTLNALLVEMDGFGTNSGTIVMAATNRPETLDSALLRSGRFDRQVLVDRPDLSGREDILKIHSQNVKLSSEIDLRQIASITSGFAGADLAALVNEAALLAARLGKNCVTMDEFTEGVERVTAGLQKRKRVMTESEKNRVAFHECGHAFMAFSLPNADPVHKVSIIPRGLAALGYTLQRPDDERFLMTKSELESQIQILLAGTIAEEIAFQDVSTGAQSDLERATGIARNMVMNFGMSRLGRVNYRENSSSSYLNDAGFVPSREHSERTAWEIDQEVKSIIDDLYQKSHDFLSGRIAVLRRLAKRLLEKEVMDADELREAIEVDCVPDEATESSKDEFSASSSPLDRRL